jgi:hypothetical protein
MAKRGGKREGAGRKRHLSPDERFAIARAYCARMEAIAAARALGRDPNRRIRVEKDERYFRAVERNLPERTIKKFQADRIAPPRPGKTVKGRRRAVRTKEVKKAVRIDGELQEVTDTFVWQTDEWLPVAESIKREVAKEFGITKRMVKRCYDEFGRSIKKQNEEFLQDKS